MNHPKNHKGKRYGSLIALKQFSSDGSGRAQWVCRCDCGRKKIVRGAHLTTGNTKSCGRCGHGRP